MQNDGSLLEEKKKNYKFSKKERTKKEIRTIRNIVIIVLLIAGFIIFKEVRKPLSIDSIDKASIGDEVTFGEATCDAWGWLWRFQAPIEWVVIEKDDEKAVLLSKYGFGYYGDYNDLLDVLNAESSFYTEKLNSDSRIIQNGQYYVTLLSREDAENKMDSIEAIKKCRPYSKQHQNLIFKGKPGAYWLSDNNGYVNKEGKIVDELGSGERVYCRPVIWVKLNQ